MIIQQSQQAIKAALNLQMRCELVGVHLKNCKVGSSRAEFKSPWNLRIRHRTAATLHEEVLLVGVVFTVQCFDASEPARLIFEMQFAFELAYAVRDQYKPATAELKAFRNGNAVFNCWPYAREFIQSMTTRLGFDVPPLPLLRMRPKANARRDAQAALKPVTKTGAPEPDIAKSTD